MLGWGADALHPVNELRCWCTIVPGSDHPRHHAAPCVEALLRELYKGRMRAAASNVNH
jgi:hypothetical protein